MDPEERIIAGLTYSPVMEGTDRGGGHGQRRKHTQMQEHLAATTFSPVI